MKVKRLLFCCLSILFFLNTGGVYGQKRNPETYVPPRVIIDTCITYLEFYEDGDLHFEITKTKDKNKISKSYDINGLCTVEFNINDSIVQLLKFNRNNNIISDQKYLGNVPFGKTVNYYDNGNTRYLGVYSYRPGWDTISLKTMVDSTGDSPLVGIYSYFLPKDGLWSYWYENGDLRKEEFYDEGVKVGTWKYYSEDGKLLKEELYKEGELVE
jgi:antitoxin component YwqK of YwqJK toxin-antitoxin module